MSYWSHSRLTSAMVSIAFWLAAAPSQADVVPLASRGTTLEEIVITATRREERLQDVPVSVTAFNQEKLDAQGLRSIDDLTRLTPGVTFQRNGMGSSANYNDENSDINIRGIDSTAGTSTTGIYIDDTPIQTRRIGFGTFNTFPALFDVERVEVLRGPQGTLFGAGSEGGTVRFITPEPSLQTPAGYLRSELATTRHGDPSAEMGAASGGPLIEDRLGFRVSASYRHDGGYVDRIDYRTGREIEPRSNWQDTMTLRAALKWRLSDTLSLTPSLIYQKLKVNDTAAYWPSLSDRGAGNFRNGNAQRNPSTDPFYLAAVRLDWDLGVAKLVSNTSFYSRNQHSISDYTEFLRTIYIGNPFPPAGAVGSAFFTDTQNNFYQEIRLASADSSSRITWNTGVFFARLNENSTEYEKDLTLDPEFLTANGTPFCTPAVPCPNGIVYYQPYARVIDRQLAGFGEIGVKLLESVKATVGVRVARVKYTGQSEGGGRDGPGAPLFGNASGSQTPVTPKAVLAWQPDRSNLLYASAAKGYRVGGTNVDYGQTAACAPDLLALGIVPGPDGVLHSPTQYKSDSLWSYEIGSKNTLFGGLLQFNASLFTVDWRDIQQSVYLPFCGNQFTANLGRVRSHGGDMSITLRPVTPLTIDLTAAYTDAKYTGTACLPGLSDTVAGCASNGAVIGKPIVSRGDRLLGAPWTLFGAGEYVFALPIERQAYLRVDYQYTTAQTALLPAQDANNAINDTTNPSLPRTSNLAVRAGLRFNGIDLSLFANNLTDAHPVLFQSRDVAAPFDTLYFQRTQRPRTIGATVIYRY